MTRFALFVFACTSLVWGGPNLLRNSDFSGGPSMTGWSFNRPGATIGEETGNPYLRLFLAEKGSLSAGQDVALPAGTREIRFASRVWVKSVVPGTEVWHAAAFACVFRDGAGKQVGGYPCAVNYKSAFGAWSRFERRLQVPDGATTFQVRLQIWEASGEVWFDDLAVEAFAESAVNPGARFYWSEEPVEVESATRGRICLNGPWAFRPGADTATPPEGGRWGALWVPGAWQTKIPTLPGLIERGAGPDWEGMPKEGNTGAWTSLNRAWYRRTLAIPAQWAGRAVALEFRRICTDGEIFLDGKSVGRVRWPWGDVDLTPFVKAGGTHQLAVRVVAKQDKTEITEFTGTAADQIFTKKIELDARGITGDVFLVSRPTGARITDVFVKPSTRRGTVDLDIEVTGSRGGPVAFTAVMRDEKGNVEKTFRAATKLVGGAHEKVSLAFPWADARKWEMDDPQNYTLMLAAEGAGLKDEYAQPFGFREFWIQGTKFYLNGHEIHLRPQIASVNEGDRDKTSVELVAGSIAGLRAMGGNIQELWPWDHWQRGTVRSHELYYAEADRVGWGMIAALGSMRGFAEKWDDNGPDRVEWERLLGDEISRIRNHPSILMYIHSPNRFGNKQDQNPQVLGNRQALTDQYDANLKAAIAGGQKANEVIRALDPTRPVTTHQGGVVGDLHTVNHYLSWHPVQEQEEWLSAWLEKGDMPFLSIEFGFFPPCDYRRGRNGWGGSVRTELLETEFLAGHFGNQAYLTESPETRRWNPANFVKGQEYCYPPKGPYFLHDPMAEEMYFRMGLRVNRAWRAAGISGGMLQWEHMHGFDDKATVGGKAIYLEPRDIAPPFAPGRRGAYVAQANMVQQFYFTPLGAATRRGGEYNTLACGPTLAFIAGGAVPGDAMAFTAKDHQFSGGQWVEKRILAQNDSRSALGVSLEWEAITGGKTLGRGRIQTNLAVSGALWQPIRFQLPEVAQKTDGEIRLSGTIGTNRATDVFSFRIFPATGKMSGTLGLWDPEGSSTRLLNAAGYLTAPWNGQSRPEILVVGRQALSKGRTPPGSLENYVKGGGHLLIMSQEASWLTGAAGFRIGHQVSRQVYGVSSNHPVTAGLDGEDLRDWTCRSTLVAEKESAPGLASSAYPFYGWHWGNRGSVASIPIEKPHGGGWRPILECDFDLAYTPLMEMEMGKGRVTLCQLDLEDAGADPVARLLTARVVDWAKRASLPLAAPTTYLGGPTGGAMLDGMSAIYSRATALPKDLGLVVLGEDVSVPDTEIEKFISRGGQIVLLPQAMPRLGFQMTPATLEGAQAIPNWTQCQGLSLSDLRLRVPTPCQVISSPIAGVDVGAGGLLARRTMGSGTALAISLNPESLGAQDKTYLRLTRWRQVRALVQVLANAGARFSSAAKLFGREEMVTGGAGPIPLAGTWLGAQVKAIPETSPGQTPPDDPGVSERAISLIAKGPQAKESALQNVSLPATMESGGGSWAHFDGEALFLKTVVVPDSWAGKDLDLSLGVVDDFDDTFWDGQKIGSTGKTQNEWWKHPRHYKIPGRLVTAGPHVIAVRVFDNFNEGGLMGPGGDMKLDLFRAPTGLMGWYHADYRGDYAMGDDPHRYYRW